jgi:hypothetical protein
MVGDCSLYSQYGLIRGQCSLLCLYACWIAQIPDYTSLSPYLYNFFYAWPYNGGSSCFETLTRLLVVTFMKTVFFMVGNVWKPWGVVGMEGM